MPKQRETKRPYRRGARNKVWMTVQQAPGAILTSREWATRVPPHPDGSRLDARDTGVALASLARTAGTGVVRMGAGIYRFDPALVSQVALDGELAKVMAENGAVAEVLAPELPLEPGPTEAQILAREAKVQDGPPTKGDVMEVVGIIDDLLLLRDCGGDVWKATRL
jgi:hypothetical protein